MPRTITLKYSGYCNDCSAPLPVGTLATWTGRGRVFGLTCHAPSATPVSWNNGMCEDAPCCGCCGITAGEID